MSMHVFRTNDAEVSDGIRHILLHCLKHGENIKASVTITEKRGGGVKGVQTPH